MRAPQMTYLVSSSLILWKVFFVSFAFLSSLQQVGGWGFETGVRAGSDKKKQVCARMSSSLQQVGGCGFETGARAGLDKVYIGARLVHQHPVTSPFNAFSRLLSTQLIPRSPHSRNMKLAGQSCCAVQLTQRDRLVRNFEHFSVLGQTKSKEEQQENQQVQLIYPPSF